jgi:hypothetical protein
MQMLRDRLPNPRDAMAPVESEPTAASAAP